MSDNNKKVVSGIVALTGTFAAPETAQATWNRSNSNSLLVTAQKSSAAQQATDALNKVKVSKKSCVMVEQEAKKAINKAKNLRNDSLKKVNQAKEILQAAKEDWQTKMIIASKKIKDFKSQPENKHLEKQADKTLQQAENARLNFREKKSEAAKRIHKLQQYENKLETVTQEQNNKILTAELAYKQAQMEQQKAIQISNNPNQENLIENRLRDTFGLQILIPESQKLVQL